VYGLGVFAVFVGLAITLLGCGSSGTQPAALPPVLPPAIKSAEPVLLYVGNGTTSADVAAIEAILKSLPLGYTTADQNQLDAMTEPELGGYKLIIVPGGNSITIGESLSTGVPGMIHNAVTQYGLHYLGVCAGAFFGGSSDYNGVNLTGGVPFNFYMDESKGIHIEPVVITLTDGNTLDAYWQDGPELSGWGNVVAKYPDGTAAITEGTVGNGFVVFTGVHLEAPAGWRAGLNFTTPVSVDVAYAGTVVQAALNGTPLPHF
jgi:hypothetical protein